MQPCDDLTVVKSRLVGSSHSIINLADSTNTHVDYRASYARALNERASVSRRRLSHNEVFATSR